MKARAHALEPAVQIGKGGAQPSVVREIDRALAAHELIKMKIDADRDERQAMADLLAERVDAAIVQRVGKVVVLYRSRPEDASGD